MVSAIGLGFMLGRPGLFDKDRNIIRADAVSPQRRNGQLLAELSNPGDSLIGRRIRSPGEQAGDLVERARGGAVRLALSQCLEIDGHHVRQQGGADRPVRREHPSDGAGESCTAPRPALARARPPNELATHVFPGGDVVPLR